MSQLLRSSEQQTAIVRRLRSAEGHLRAVIDMVELGKPCEEVLQQLAAVEAAINAAGRALRYGQFRRSVETILHDTHAETRLTEVARLAALYGLNRQPVFDRKTSDE